MSADAEAHDIAALRAENLRLLALVEQGLVSATVQGMRAGALGGEAHGQRQIVDGMRSSFFWRLTAPLRVSLDLARGAGPGSGAEAQMVRRALAVAKAEGPLAAWRRAAPHLRARAKSPMRKPAASRTDGRRQSHDASAWAVTRSPDTLFAPNVLIIAELTLPQCAKYRVWQKQELFHRLGVRCRVVDWRDIGACREAATLASRVILYRVPYYPDIKRLISELKRLLVPLYWEVDDLIFDEALYLQNRNLDQLDPELRESILSGVQLYRDCMLACGHGIASTPHLADAMRAAGLAHVDVVENALDAETLGLAEELRQRRSLKVRGAHDGVLITYGSGTKTHDADFLAAAPALLRLLQDDATIRLRIVGELNLPEEFDVFGERVERLPPTHYAGYLRLLAESDISIAPLEATLFNDAKSNIKYLEAAVLGLPSVCSPRANFATVVQDGVNGLLAEGDDAWLATLRRLADDAELRDRIGDAARSTALARYAPDAVAVTQLAPWVGELDRRPHADLRVLMANVYFAPRSYGGATIVTEEMARRLNERDDTAVHVVTTRDPSDDTAVPGRWEAGGIAVHGLSVALHDMVAEFDDPSVGAAFGHVLDAVRPDVVHLHSVQWLSASIARACRDRDIPYVITVHDAWFLCARQFMVQANGRYCGQTRIDLHVCEACNPGAHHLGLRRTLLLNALHGAALLISPSEAHRQLFLANGIAPERIIVGPNGVRAPVGPVVRTPSPRLRFAYVGGNVEVKGFSIVKRAFEAVASSDYELVLVDNTLNLGFSSVNAAEWQLRGTLHVIPAYTQNTMDEFFAGVDVLVFPSQWHESFGLTVREAMLRDVWVIVTAGGGAAEAVTEGVNGNIIPLDGRPQALLAAIEALLSKPLKNYLNPLKAEIITYEKQASTLHRTLKAVAGKDWGESPPPDPGALKKAGPGMLSPAGFGASRDSVQRTTPQPC